MNRSRTKGVLLTLLGKLQRNLGSAIGNPRLIHRGHLRIIEGRAALAIGEAQALIQRCLAQRGTPRPRTAAGAHDKPRAVHGAKGA
jgi:hypothetical protein